MTFNLRAIVGVVALALTVVTVALLAIGPDITTSEDGVPDVECFSPMEGANPSVPRGAEYDETLPPDEPVHEAHLALAIENAGIDADGDGSPDQGDAARALADAARGCDLARSQRTGAALLIGLLAVLLWSVTLLAPGKDRRREPHP